MNDKIKMEPVSVLENQAQQESKATPPVKHDEPSFELRYPFLLENLHQTVPALLDLLDMDAFEVYLADRAGRKLTRVYRSGKLTAIWNPDLEVDENHLLLHQFEKGEQRVINLPNSRIKELNTAISEKALGQVICMPITSGGDVYGITSLAHTRRSLLTDREMNYFNTLVFSLAEMVAYENDNQQARIQIISEERERIGMDLHDGIIQSLYGIGLSLENARISQVQGKNNSVQQIEKALEALQSAIADIRAYILDLRPRQLRHANMVEGMRSLIREFRANTMVDVSMEGQPEDVEGLARTQIDALYHIFQEALSNTAKHAKATRVTVRLWRQDDRIMLKVSDDGSGFDTPRPGGRIGHGLTNMQARAEAAGGGMEVISIRKQGTTLLAWVPYVKE
ncbi:MAG: two-component system, NarL family, sensor histidine kinase LiaS [Chloroflexota bacterium]|nr:two-component system, NarL family, sensor histidine kinase LiaS [Chloroflexota bacterium]